MTNIRLACRQLMQSPLFTTVATVALGLGIGAATTAFGAYNTIRLKPIPLLLDQDRLVRAEEYLRNDPKTELGFSCPDYFDVVDQSKSLAGIAVMRGKTFILTDRERPVRLLGAEVSARMFSVLGVRPLHGRDFRPEEEGPGRAPVVLLGHGLWQERYGGDTAIVGRTIELSGQPAVVVGVMPPGWRFPEEADLWSPLTCGRDTEKRGDFYLQAVARLKPGVEWSEGAAELETISARLAAQHPDTNEGIGIRIVPWRRAITQDVGRQLALLLGAVLFVQLIACANVANLLLARGAARSREFAIRLALGARRGQVIRQLLTEGLVLGVLGGAMGFLMALWGRDLCRAGIRRELPFWVDFDFDLRVFAFAASLTLVSVLVFALVPALQTARPDVMEELREGARGAGAGRRQVRIRHALVVVEIALALVLLVGAGLMLRSFIKTQTVHPGYEARGVLTFRVGLPPQHFTNRNEFIRFFQQVRERLAAMPGVRGAAAVSLLPAMEWQSIMAFRKDGEAEPPLAEAPRLDGHVATPGYFATMGIPLLEGRDFADTDVTNAPSVCIVDETFARIHYPGTSAMGGRIFIGGGDDKESPKPRTIVGVVRSVQARYDGRPPLPAAYLPHTQWPEAFLSFAVRVEGDPQTLVGDLQREVFSVHSQIPIYNVRTMEQILERHTWDKRFFGGLFAGFAGIALFLAALGIYGVMAYTVGQRTPELGLRIALGAEESDVLRLVLKQGIRLALLGLAVGFAASFLLTHLLKGVLFGVSPYDPPVFVIVPLLLAAVAVAASLLPAWRATRIAPMAALRCG